MHNCAVSALIYMMLQSPPQVDQTILQIECLACHKFFRYDGLNPTCCLGDAAYDSFVSRGVQTRAQLKHLLQPRWQDWPGLGHTPLVNMAIGSLGGRPIFGKGEHRNPTGSFKDRESETALNVAKAQGVREVTVISSGNAAVSAAAFARELGLGCRVYIPEKTSAEKQTALQETGARITLLPGVFEDVYRAALTLPEKAYHVSAGQNPFRELGSAEIARELFDEIGLPDHILVPAGNGLLLWGIYRGFQRLLEEKSILRLPRIHAVQIEGAAPLAEAVRLGRAWAVLADIPDSIAEGIVAQESYCAPKALMALRVTGGSVLEVRDADIRRWQGEVTDQPELDLEETALAVFPALEQLKAGHQEIVVAILTGSRGKPHFG
jgi:threonine synthase